VVNRKKLAYALVTCATLVSGSALADGAHVQPISDFVNAEVKAWLSESVLVNAVKAQNERHAALAQPEVDKMDKQWRAEVDAASKPMIDAVIRNELSGS
jgi:hypothetical protein